MNPKPELIAELESPKSLTEEKFQELAQHEWFMRSETMPKIAPEVFEAIYQALLPHIASAQSAQDHEAMEYAQVTCLMLTTRENVLEYLGRGLWRSSLHGNDSAFYTPSGALLNDTHMKVQIDGNGQIISYPAILAAKEQDGK